MIKRSESCGVVRRSGWNHSNLARERSCGSVGTISIAQLS
ncbi:hypothetical protein J2X75_003610 [Paenibacillus sp. 2003]|nr:hypothetical protein [Paenibacillus sp. 2003]